MDSTCSRTCEARSRPRTPHLPRAPSLTQHRCLYYLGWQDPSGSHRRGSSAWDNPLLLMETPRSFNQQMALLLSVRPLPNQSLSNTNHLKKLSLVAAYYPSLFIWCCDSWAWSRSTLCSVLYSSDALQMDSTCQGQSWSARACNQDSPQFGWQTISTQGCLRRCDLSSAWRASQYPGPWISGLLRPTWQITL